MMEPTCKIEFYTMDELQGDLISMYNDGMISFFDMVSKYNINKHLLNEYNTRKNEIINFTDRVSFHERLMMIQI